MSQVFLGRVYMPAAGSARSLPSRAPALLRPRLPVGLPDCNRDPKWKRFAYFATKRRRGSTNAMTWYPSPNSCIGASKVCSTSPSEGRSDGCLVMACLRKQFGGHAVREG